MDYRFERVTSKVYGRGDDAYWIIEPRDAWDKPLPVVLFVHGFGLTNFGAYRTWINHLVARGNIVIYPAYHVGGLVDPTAFTETTAKAARRALARCDGKRHKLADTERFTMIGHSLGGTIIANLAARPKHYGLPRPDALMLLQPGDTRADRGLGALFPSITEDHATISADTLMFIVDVENDYFVSPEAGQRIYDGASAIRVSDKRRLLLSSDVREGASIVADHMLPMAWTYHPNSQGRVNAYDFAVWRWFDALQALSHGDEAMRERVFGEAALDVGAWSDGVPVRRPVDTNAKHSSP
jgi:pimeloyl-ACP methyl ester carboxylesterase